MFFPLTICKFHFRWRSSSRPSDSAVKWRLWFWNVLTRYLCKSLRIAVTVKLFIFLTAVVVMITLLYHVDEWSFFLVSLFTPSQTTWHYDIMITVLITNPVKTSAYCTCQLALR